MMDSGVIDLFRLALFFYRWRLLRRLMSFELRAIRMKLLPMSNPSSSVC